MHVSLIISIFPDFKFNRSARILTCEQLSSAAKYKTFLVSERCAAICVNRVDLPMPGSPPNRTSEPATMPPPKTLSNSEIPEGVRLYRS